MLQLEQVFLRFGLRLFRVSAAHFGFTFNLLLPARCLLTFKMHNFVHDQLEESADSFTNHITFLKLLEDLEQRERQARNLHRVVETDPRHRLEGQAGQGLPELGVLRQK